MLLVAIAALWWWKRTDDTGDGNRSDLGTSRESAAVIRRRAAGGAAGASLSGHVTRAADGAVVAHALVAVGRQDASRTLAVSDDAGAWAVPDAPPGVYTVEAMATGYLPRALHAITVAAGDDASGLDLALVTGGITMHGRVSDIGGGPVAAARITATPSDDVEDSAPVTVTGVDGTYQLTLAATTYELTAGHDDYASKSRTLNVAAGLPPIDFVLVPGGSIRGQVIARDTGQPVPDARVDDYSSNVAQTTGADGTFLLGPLRSGVVELHVRAHGYATLAPAEVPVAVGEQVRDVQIVVEHTPTIRGRVVRAEMPSTGIAGARVSAFGGRFGSISRLDALALTDATGAFELVGAVPETYQLHVRVAGWMPSFDVEVAVGDRDVDGVRVPLAAGVMLSGRIEPPGPAQLELVTSDRSVRPDHFGAKVREVRGVSATDGTFALRGAPPGTYTLQATATSGAVGQLLLVVADADRTALVVPLVAKSVISGRVVDTSGRPVIGARVEVSAPGAGIARYGYRGLSALSGADGAFRVEGVEPGTAEVGVMDGDADDSIGWTPPGLGKQAVTALQVTGGADREDVVLTVATRDGVIRGVVTTPDGHPVADVWVRSAAVTARRGGPDDEQPFHGIAFTVAAPVLTGPDGRFAISRLTAGTYALDVDSAHESGFAHLASVSTGDTVSIVISLCGVLTGHVTAGGKPVSDFDLTCLGPSSVYGRHVTAHDGAFRLERLRPGHYSCSVTLAAGASSGEVDVGGTSARLDFVVENWGAVTGTVVDVLTGAAIVGAQVSIRQSSLQVFQTDYDSGLPKTDARGQFVVRQAPAGTGVLLVSSIWGDADLATMKYAVAAGERVDVGTVKSVAALHAPRGELGLTLEAWKVVAMDAGGAADNAGLRVGDQVVAIEGHSVAELGALAGEAFYAVSAGQQRTLFLARGITVTLTATAPPY